MSGTRIITPISRHCRTNDNTVVHFRLVLSLPEDSKRLSSNMALSPCSFQPFFRHRQPAFCSRASPVTPAPSRWSLTGCPAAKPDQLPLGLGLHLLPAAGIGRDR